MSKPGMSKLYSIQAETENRIIQIIQMNAAQLN